MDHKTSVLFSFADQNHSISKGICLNALFVAWVELRCKSQSFPREVPLLENTGVWQNEAIFQVCAGVDSYSSSQGVLRARRSSNSRESQARGCVSASLLASQEGNGDQQWLSREGGERQERNGWVKQDVYL